MCPIHRLRTFFPGYFPSPSVFDGVRSNKLAPVSEAMAYIQIHKSR